MLQHIFYLFSPFVGSLRFQIFLPARARQVRKPALRFFVIPPEIPKNPFVHGWSMLAARYLLWRAVLGAGRAALAAWGSDWVIASHRARLDAEERMHYG